MCLYPWLSDCGFKALAYNIARKCTGSGLVSWHMLARCRLRLDGEVHYGNLNGSPGLLMSYCLKGEWESRNLTDVTS